MLNAIFLSYLTLFSPLAGIFSLYLFPKRSNKLYVGLSSAFILLGGISALLLLTRYYTSERILLVTVHPFISFAATKSVNWSIRLDALSLLMVTMVYMISLMVHLYSLGYLNEEQNLRRFMSYLSLFTFFMLLLLVSDNLIQLFVGWEGVGLCSYLLIGYWFHKDSATKASYKAFIVNRIGDACFILGLCALYTYGDSFNLIEIKLLYHTSTLGKTGWSQAIGLFFLIGAMSKSAQIGLHVWLPDAMEGPTPVSALIHAATMVTAGIFLLVRLSFIYQDSPALSTLIMLIGALTAFFAATVALTQYDIKRIIAYSTCSQLGIMFVAIGCKSYHAAIFHLLTHAFFKALLFLGAGSVIHGFHNRQDIRQMGNLKSAMPYTFALILIGNLAISGIFPFAGYYSKEFILENLLYLSGHHHSGTILTQLITQASAILTIIAASLTALYSFRLLFVVFSGAYRGPEEAYKEIHESKAIILLPMSFLAIMSLASGFMGDKLFNLTQSENNFLNHEMATGLVKPHLPALLHYLPLALSIFMIVFAYVYYGKRRFSKLSFSFPTYESLRNFCYNKWYFDELYQYAFVKPIRILGSWTLKTDNLLSQSFLSGAERLLWISNTGKRLSNLLITTDMAITFGALLAGLIVLILVN